MYQFSYLFSILILLFLVYFFDIYADSLYTFQEFNLSACFMKLKMQKKA